MLHIQLLTILPEYEFARLVVPWILVLFVLSLTYANIQRGKLEKQNESLRRRMMELEKELDSLRQQ